MIPKQEEYFQNRFTLALSRPLKLRCAELTVLFDRASMKDLHNAFPILVESIFGSNGSQSWELQMIANDATNTDFQAVLHFLSPVGVLFRVIYTLLRDPYLKFEYSLNFLPERLRQNLEHLKSHPFYSDLIQADSQRNAIICLSLNPFDYFMFHFAYHLINPFYLRGRNTAGRTWGSLYYSLCCDYIVHFLPTNPSNIVLPELPGYNGKNPLYTIPLFKQAASPTTIKMPILDYHPRNEIWRSETVMTVFTDMWLNSDQVLMSSYDFGGSFNISAILPSKPKFNMNEMPTGEYIRIVRVLIKQLHSFASSGKVDDTHMKELKRIVLSHLQPKMYIFLRHLIYRWPLDGSFRLVLELWLSYLQPWRYPGNEHLKLLNPGADVHADLEDMNLAPMKAVDEEYMKFMAENLLAYTVILQQLLPRFIRVDLSSPKLALILFRLSKVFAQPNLIKYLREIEASLDGSDGSPVHCKNTQGSGNKQALPPLSPTSTWSENASPNYTNYMIKHCNPDTTRTDSLFAGKWLTIVKQKISELEGSTFHYKPIFSTTPASEVNNLIHHVKRCEQLAQAIVREKLEEIRQKNSGFIGQLKSLLLLTETTNDEFTLEERKKVPVYLQHSLHNLVEIFQIRNYVNDDYTEDFSNILSRTTNPHDITTLLSPQKVFERVRNMKYEGNPDLHPVTSHEFKFLVRILYQLSSNLNEEYQSEIKDAYYKDNLFGKLARQVLQEPIVIHTYEKQEFGQSLRIPHCLPPRISLRYFASHQFFFLFVFFLLLSKLFTCSYAYFPIIVYSSYIFYIFVKALFSKSISNTDEHSDHFVDASDTLNLSDSF